MDGWIERKRERNKDTRKEGKKQISKKNETRKSELGLQLYLLYFGSATQSPTHLSWILGSGSSTMMTESGTWCENTRAPRRLVVTAVQTNGRWRIMDVLDYLHIYIYNIIRLKDYKIILYIQLYIYTNASQWVTGSYFQAIIPRKIILNLLKALLTL